MRRYAPRVLSVAALIGLAVSAWLLVQYLLPPSQALCGPGGGCHAVRTCWLARVGSGQWPLWPTLGVIAFAAMLILSFATDPKWRSLLPVAGYTAIGAGAFLLVSQRVVCHAFCPYCVVTDTAAILAGSMAVVGRREVVSFPIWSRWLFGCLGVAAVVMPFGWLKYYTTDVQVQGEHLAQLPGPIQAEQRAGVVTLVEFADFECPYCRRQHVELSQVLPLYGPRVRLVRRHVPLRFHTHADGAARAALCAEAQGHGDEMADRAFREEDISPEGCAHMAAELHLDMTAFGACLQSAETTARLAADQVAATASGVQGLPTMFIGNVRFEGVVTAALLRQTIDRQLRSGG